MCVYINVNAWNIMSAYFVQDTVLNSWLISSGEASWCSKEGISLEKCSWEGYMEKIQEDR